MRLPTLSSDAGTLLSELGDAVEDLITPTIRLGVTGLSRSGKTVFITSLVRCLLEGGAAPPLSRVTSGPGMRCFLEPQPDDQVPRFAYEEHLAALTGDPPHWPESTRRISQLRLTFEWDGEDFARQALGMKQRLHVDIVDYPGEWLIDLGLMRQSFSEWSAEALGYARSTRVPEAARPFLDFLDGVDPSAGEDEAIAMRGAELFTDYLRKAKRTEPSRAILGPGRFLLPGDLEGSPLVTFFPIETGEPSRPHTLGALLSRRFESYKTHVVEPFFKDHFSRLDRQIVLIDMLTSLNGGAQGLNDLEHGLEGVLRAFRPGRNSWLSLILPKRIDRIAFAATKADHIHKFSHARLSAVLEKAVSRAAQRASEAHAETAFFALAGLKSTVDVEKNSGAAAYRCVRGIPENGEQLGRERFDGIKEAVVFPGDLPDDPLDAFDPERAEVGQYSFLRFAPPPKREHDAEWPHVGLDRAVTFLFGDYLP